LVVEGAGGVFVPLNDTDYVIDLIQMNIKWLLFPLFRKYQSYFAWLKPYKTEKAVAGLFFRRWK
jgi:hypothetical protein